MISQHSPADADLTTAGFAVRRRGRLRSMRQSGASEPSPSRGPQFSKQEIVAKVGAWTARYGVPPSTKDWEPSRARAAKQEWRARRFEAGEWPSATMVRRRFGTFNAAIRAAGLEPRGGPPRQKAHLSGPDQVLAAIVEWTRRYGAPPSQTDWDSARARRAGQTWRVARYEDGDWPSFNTVRRHFGSLNRAILEAGLRPRQPGQRQERAPHVRLDVLLSLATSHRVSASSRSAQLANAIRTVAAMRRAGDHVNQRRALVELAAVALAWAADIQACAGDSWIEDTFGLPRADGRTAAGARKALGR
jgi:hypothetical protein